MKFKNENFPVELSWLMQHQIFKKNEEVRKLLLEKFRKL